MERIFTRIKTEKNAVKNKKMKWRDKYVKTYTYILCGASVGGFLGVVFMFALSLPDNLIKTKLSDELWNGEQIKALLL